MCFLNLKLVIAKLKMSGVLNGERDPCMVSHSLDNAKIGLNMETYLPGDVVVHWSIYNDESKSWEIPAGQYPPETITFKNKALQTLLQAHLRGYQVRKYYKVILEKVVLRWRRHEVGLRGFRPEIELIEENEEEDILKVFRKRTMNPAIDESVSRVLAMVILKSRSGSGGQS